MRDMVLLRLLVILTASVVAAPARDADFNGRWNLTVKDETRHRAWWLEVSGAGGRGPLKGRFVGAPGGDMDVIRDLAIDNGELKFTFDRGGLRTYRAKVVKGQLAGTMDSPGGKATWIGRRAPVIRDRDDGSWREGKPVELFNQTDLNGWQPLIPGKELGWTVRGGSMANVAGANNLISKQKFWNFALHVEFRLGEHSNSGIGLRGRYEIQILEDYGRPPNPHSNGAVYSRIAPRKNASKPADQWQTYDIRLVGRQVTVVLNGEKIIDKQEIEGLTAIASDPNEASPGSLILQGDHGPVEFRKVVLTPLVR